MRLLGERAMDVEMIYPHGPYRIVLGYSDEKQEHFARIETNANEPEVQWEYQTPPGISGSSAVLMLGDAQEAARSIIGLEHFEIDAYDSDQLKNAPYSRQVNPGELVRIDALDTDYLAGFDQYTSAIDDALPELEDAEQERADCMTLLQVCVEMLSELQPLQHIREEDLNHTRAFVETQKDNAIAITAWELVMSSYELATTTGAGSRRADDVVTSGQEPWDINDLFREEEIVQIDSFTHNLCGSRLTDFPQAVLERGYDPTTGLPLDCQNPESFSWEQSIPDNIEALYIQYGMADEDASRAVTIQRTDPRDRSDDDWTFLEATVLDMNAFAKLAHNRGE